MRRRSSPTSPSRECAQAASRGPKQRSHTYSARAGYWALHSLHSRWVTAMRAPFARFFAASRCGKSAKARRHTSVWNWHLPAVTSRWLPGLRRASPSTPLDVSSYVRASVSTIPAGASAVAVTLPGGRCRRSWMDSPARTQEVPKQRLREQRPLAAPTPLQATSPAAKRRMLIIVNPYAATVSDRLRHLVVYALQGRFDVDAIDTQARGHAVEICREAAHEGYDVVVAFGRDGTVNEAANGLLRSPPPPRRLPGGPAHG